MPDAESCGGPQALCASRALLEKGRAVLFDVLLYGQPARGFALRYEGRVVAYLNRCLHMPAELDWQPGDFLDGDREFIMCSLHGAVYEPLTGRCAGGPCGRGRLMAIETIEERGEGFWRPSRDIRPAATAPAGPPLPGEAG